MKQVLDLQPAGAAVADRVLVTDRFSPARVQRMHAAMARHVAPGKLPGLVMLVNQRGREYVDAIGIYGFDRAVPMQRDTIFRLASMTKPVTAVAAMILVEECRLRLDDSIDEWLPELKDRRVLRTIDSRLNDTVPAARSITLRDLLTFRSGYGEVAFISPMCPLQQALAAARLPLTVWPYAGTAEEFMQSLGKLPLAFQPGERWLYHLGAEILGVLIARVAGQSLGRFLRERIFEPLGMKDTGFYLPETKLGRLPACYGTEFPTSKLVKLYEAGGGPGSQPPAFEGGGGGLVSTVDDMLAFGQMLLDYGAYGPARILARPTVELMTTDQISPEQKASSPFFPGYWDYASWGLGLGLITGRRDTAGGPGRFGWDGAFGTSWWVDPKEGLVGVFMTQRRPDALGIPPSILDFWTSAYQLIDD